MRHMRHSPVRNVMKTTVKRGKKISECCYRCPSGPPEPSLLPPANSSNHLTVLSAVQRHRLCCTGKRQKCRIFPFEGWFQPKWGDCPTATGLERVLVSPYLEHYKQWANNKWQLLQENSTCGQPKFQQTLSWGDLDMTAGMTDSIFRQIKQLYRNISDQWYLWIRLHGVIQQSHTSKLFSLKFFSVYESK